MDWKLELVSVPVTDVDRANADVRAARVELVERGVEVGDVRSFSGAPPSSFSDPDGNRWAVQQLPARV